MKSIPLMPASLSIDVIVSAPFMENTLVVHRDGRTDCLVIDPGFEPRKIVRHLEERQWEPAAILLTHGHVDHIAGNGAMRQRWPELPIWIGAGDAVMLTDPRANLSFLGGSSVVSPPADRLLHEGKTIDLAGIELQVLEIPGHSPGHVVYVIRTETPHIVLGGDVLFQGSIGRCDFPGGNQRQLVQGIRTKLFVLPDDALVYPGHGDPTTIGEERETNPFCGRHG